MASSSLSLVQAGSPAGGDRPPATVLFGHKLIAELSCDQPPADAHNAMLPPDVFRLPAGRPVTHKVYRDARYPSRLVLPHAA